jgi:hypothetical protein
MALGCIGEVIGWYGRFWSSNSPGLLDPFLMQIVCTIISPSFMSAANFTILGLIIKRLGSQYSWLTPRWCTFWISSPFSPNSADTDFCIDLIIFIGFDLGALVVQSIGGSQASSAARRGVDADVGGRIMLYGIIVQMIALTIYVALGAEFVIRYLLDRPVRQVSRSEGASAEALDEKNSERPPMEKNVRIMLIGLVINAVFFFIR